MLDESMLAQGHTCELVAELSIVKGKMAINEGMGYFAIQNCSFEW